MSRNTQNFVLRREKCPVQCCLHVKLKMAYLKHISYYAFSIFLKLPSQPSVFEFYSKDITLRRKRFVKSKVLKEKVSRKLGAGTVAAVSVVELPIYLNAASAMRKCLPKQRFDHACVVRTIKCLKETCMIHFRSCRVHYRVYHLLIVRYMQCNLRIFFLSF